MIKNPIQPWGRRRRAFRPVAMGAAWLLAGAVSVGAPPSLLSPFETDRSPRPRTRIDAIVLGALQKNGIEPAPICSDAVFLRRVFLDLIGTLPTLEETSAFLADAKPGKRERLVEALLQRPEYVDYWTLRWADLLRVKAEFPIRLWPKASEAYYRWIGQAIAENRPYDRFARDLLLATGSNFYAPAANFYRALPAREPDDLARMVALTFMGVRGETWPAAQWAEMGAFFSRIRYKGTSEWKEEIVYLDPQPSPATTLRLPDGSRARIAEGADARAAFADWLISSRNPWFARVMANRMWYWLVGRGIVHEPDDFRPDNPPAIPELLDYLASELAASGWDLRRLQRLIVLSDIYQQSSVPRSADARVDVLFARYLPRRLDAEVLIDAICQVTGTNERYVSPVPEPFTYVPEDMRTIELPDGNSTSAFLELFGRPPRDTGLLSERNNASNAGQRLHLLNSNHIHQKIVRSDRLRRLAATAGSPRTTVDRLYLLILSRLPSAEERQAALDYAARSGGRMGDAVTDLAWALINSEEFLHRH